MASAGRPGPLLPVPTAQYERDVKRMKKRGKDLAKLRAIVESLRAGPTLPARCRDHIPSRADGRAGEIATSSRIGS